MNTHERVMAALANCRTQPASTAQIQEELKQHNISYAVLSNCLNELVRSGKMLESRNAVDKRVFSVKGGGAS